MNNDLAARILEHGLSGAESLAKPALTFPVPIPAPYELARPIGRTVLGLLGATWLGPLGANARPIRRRFPPQSQSHRRDLRPLTV